MQKVPGVDLIKHIKQTILKKYAVVIVVIFTLCNLILTAEAADLRIHFIDVEEGDSILIQTPNDKVVLVDTGNPITGHKVVEYLNQNDIDDLSYLILTHPHLDHIGGVFLVLQEKNLGKVCDNGQDLTEMKKTSEIYNYYEKLVREHNNYMVLSTNDEFTLDNVNFNILWPNEHLPLGDVNNHSLVIMVNFKKFRCLLTGDIGVSVEKELLKQNNNLKIDVLKIGHHGGSNTSCKEFLEKTFPKIAIITATKNPIDGYPAEEVLNRLETIGIKVYRTDKNGNILIEADGVNEPVVSIEN